MKELFSRAGIILTDEQEKAFARYAELLLEYNEKFNLTAITKIEDIYEKHFLDSALGSTLFSENAKIIDVGSGAGFPAIPLKIVRNDLKITMLDSLQKRVGFLDVVIKELGLTEITAVHARAEDYAKTPARESFDYATARAVAPLNVLAEYCLPFVKVGGSFVAYKGQNADAELSDAEAAVRTLGGEEPSLRTYELPSGDKRAFVQIEKSRLSPAKYPRGQNKPRLW